MKIKSNKFKEVKLGLVMQWTEDCVYGKAGDNYTPKEDELAFAGLMYGNGFLKEADRININAMDDDKNITGQHIVVLDRGFVYVGNITINDEYLFIYDAQCIRSWGTTKGLAELINGPTAKTQLDAKCNVIAPIKSVIHYIKCSGF